MARTHSGVVLGKGFAGTGRPLDAGGIQDALDLLGVKAADIWAVIKVETSGCGFFPDRRPKILFERHVFSSKTKHRFDATYPEISNPTPGGYGPSGAAQYNRLARAMALDRHAALLSASWGLGQLMGYHAAVVGYASVEDMISAMADSENAHVEAMARFIAACRLNGALRTHDWARFARGYNGPNYRINNYDARLAATHDQLERNGLPDVVLRAAQLYLTYLGYELHGIDGVMGRLTRSAMNDYQARNNIPLTDDVDDRTFVALKEAAELRARRRPGRTKRPKR